MKSQQLEGYNSINKLGLTLHVQTDTERWMSKCRMMKTKMALYSYNSVD